MVTVVIPWRPQPSRVAALEAVTAWYAQNLPEATVTLVDTDDEIFNLARCRNVGVAAAAAGEVVVINDADTLPEIEALSVAIAAAPTSSVVHLPYTEYRWLGASGSREFAEGMPLPQCDFVLISGACSGVYVTTPETWARLGGQDERFRGWGFEDAAWYVAHETLAGEVPRRNEGRVYALHHQAEPREGEQYDANAALMERYRDASGDAEAMRQLSGVVAS
jgi:hypothetical protein